MSTADWVVILVVAVSGLYGIATGFLRGAFSLAGFALGAYLGARLAPALLSDASPYVPAIALAFAILGGMLMRGVASLLAGALRASLGVIPGVRLLDSLAGLVLGLAAGVLLCWAVGAVLLYLPGQPDLRRTVQKSAILSRINDEFPPERLLATLERVDPIGVLLGPPAVVPPPDSALARDPDVIRASKSVGGYHDFAIGERGIEIYPRLVAAAHRSAHSSALRRGGRPKLWSVRASNTSSSSAAAMSCGMFASMMLRSMRCESPSVEG